MEEYHPTRYDEEKLKADIDEHSTRVQNAHGSVSQMWSHLAIVLVAEAELQTRNLAAANERAAKAERSSERYALQSLWIALSSLAVAAVSVIVGLIGLFKR